MNKKSFLKLFLGVTMVLATLSSGVSANSDDLKIKPDLKSLSIELGIPLKNLEEKWQKYENSDPVLSLIDEGVILPGIESDLFIQSDLRYNYQNRIDRHNIFTCRYIMTASSTSTMNIDSIEARARLYSAATGQLVDSETDTQTNSNRAGAKADANTESGGWGGCGGHAYGNNVWKHSGYEDTYNQSYWDISDL